MTGNVARPAAYLDALRAQSTPEEYRAKLSSLCAGDKRHAALLLSDERLSFPALFSAREQIVQHGLKMQLSGRHIAALGIAEQILARNPKGEGSSYLKGPATTELSVLLWMLATGFREEGLRDAYDEVLDGVVAVLLDLYHEKRALPYAVDLLFLRARSGRNYHDLFWAISRLGDPSSLRLIAARLDAPDTETAATARELLGVDDTQGNMHFSDYERWLRENDPFLYFAGESMQYSAKPAVFRVDHARKYVNRATPAYEKQALTPQNEQERARLAEFSALEECDRAILAQYAHEMRKKDPAAWSQLETKPVAQQAEAAKKNGGETVWSI